MGFAHWVNKSLIVQSDDGGLGPPGAGYVEEWEQPTGKKVVLISRGEAFDVYIAGRKEVYNFSVSSRSFVSIAWWVLKWWIFAMWCGAKLAMWEWSLGKIMQRKNRAAH